jgi:hypothetical protein
MPYNVVDLFCGVGGLTHGFVTEGFKVIGGIDTDRSCKYAYEANNVPARFIECNVEKLTVEDLAQLYPAGAPKILVGCAPCQPFSLYTNSRATLFSASSFLYLLARVTMLPIISSAGLSMGSRNAASGWCFLRLCTDPFPSSRHPTQMDVARLFGPRSVISTPSLLARRVHAIPFIEHVG